MLITSIKASKELIQMNKLPTIHPARMGFTVLFLLFTISYSLFTIHCSAQKQIRQRIDSMISVLSVQKMDTGKVNLLNKLSREYYTINDKSDSAYAYAQHALALAEKLQFISGQVTALKYIGNCHAAKSDAATAIEYYQKAITFSKEVGDKQSLIQCHRNIGCLFRNLSESLNHYQQALALAINTDDKPLIIDIYYDLGYMFTIFNNNPAALENYQKALNISEKFGARLNTAKLFIRIGILYRNLGDGLKALSYMEKALAINRQLGDQENIAYCLTNIGINYMWIGKYEKSLDFFNQAVEVKKLLNDELSTADDYANMAYIYQITGDYATAVTYHRKSLVIYNKFQSRFGEMLYLKDMSNLIQKAPDSILVQINIHPNYRYRTAIDYGERALKLAAELNNPIQKISVLEFLIPAYEKLGNFKAAFYNIQDYFALSDSIQGQTTKEEIARKEMTYDFEKKETIAKAEQGKKDLRQKTIRNSLMGGLFAFILFSAVIYKQHNKVKKEKRRSDELLLNILPSEIAEELKAKGIAEARQFDEVSVLFTDFVHFTQTAENLQPRQLVQELNECFTAFDNIIERNGLEKIKTIGDAYLAVCGLPAADPRHAQKAIQAALEIRDFIEDRSKKGKTFQVRIGIHSGSVVAGIVGVKKFAYDIWGDTVNTAARMEQSSETGKVNISEATYDLVKNAPFVFEHRGKVAAKNKGELDMYFVEKNQEF